ncbi:hypothetical protein IWQ62_004353 [Dispira parvispora]|uniref:Uncharacterized protein n=1 Tax=Dispira parvispora TaxID=1520584 RepID=A0A9W8E0R5_9FUNG|nr:hypothetical protein IWQ62_004353 [Dispira parvispora]
MKSFTIPFPSILAILTVLWLSVYIITSQAELLAFQHATVYYDKRLYLTGGYRSTERDKNSFLTHDYSLYLGGAFSTHVPSWETSFVDRSEGPVVAGHTATLVRTKDSAPMILVSGGNAPPVEKGRSSFVAYNLKLKSWTRWGIDNARYWGASAVYAPRIKKVLYFGGQRVDGNEPMQGSETNELHILDPVSLEWKVPSYHGHSLPEFLMARYQHQGVMMNETHMVILGGCSGDDMVDPNEVHIYDTVNEVWSQPEVTGAWFSGLKLFGVASYFGNVIVTGGVTNVEETDFFGDVAVLNTAGNTWRWERPPLPAQEYISMKRYGHTTTLIGKYLVNAMGLLQADVDQSSTESNVTKRSVFAETKANGGTTNTRVNLMRREDSEKAENEETQLMVAPHDGYRNDEPHDKDQLVVIDVSTWKTVEWFDLDQALDGATDGINKRLMELSQGVPHLSVGAIVGIVVGSIGLIGAIILLVWFCRARRGRWLFGSKKRLISNHSSTHPSSTGSQLESGTIVGDEKYHKTKNTLADSGNVIEITSMNSEHDSTVSHGDKSNTLSDGQIKKELTQPTLPITSKSRRRRSTDPSGVIRNSTSCSRRSSNAVRNSTLPSRGTRRRSLTDGCISDSQGSEGRISRSERVRRSQITTRNNSIDSKSVWSDSTMASGADVQSEKRKSKRRSKRKSSSRPVSHGTPGSSSGSPWPTTHPVFYHPHPMFVPHPAAGQPLHLNHHRTWHPSMFTPPPPVVYMTYPTPPLEAPPRMPLSMAVFQPPTFPAPIAPASPSEGNDGKTEKRAEEE